MPATLRAFPPPARRCRGAPLTARAIVARTRYAVAAPLRKARGVKLWLSLLLWLLAPSPPLRGGEGWGERALFTPLCGGESGTIRPRSGSRHGCRLLFARAGDGMDAGVEATQDAVARCPIEKPGPDSRTCRASPGKRQAGWPSLWPLSLGHPRESGSRSARSAKALALYQPSKARASRTSALLQKARASLAGRQAGGVAGVMVLPLRAIPRRPRRRRSAGRPACPAPGPPARRTDVFRRRSESR